MSTSYTAVFLKVVFPPTSQIASKKFNLDSNLTVKKAIAEITQVNCGLTADNSGLFIPSKNFWLEESKTLKDYEELLVEVETLELREKSSTNTSLSTSQSTTLIVGIGIIVAVSAIAAAVYFGRKR